MLQFGAEVKGDARTVVSIKYPEFEQGSDDEDESEDEDEEDDSEIKLPKLITKEAVLAILKPNVVRTCTALDPKTEALIINLPTD